MKIVVLAGGISTERTVSLVTGISVCRTLRKIGHQAVFVDSFMGISQENGSLEPLFDIADGCCPDLRIGETAPDLDEVRASRRDQSSSSFGPRVLEICALADIVFIGLHGQDGEDGRVQAMFDLLGIPYTGSGYLASGLAMDKIFSKKLMDAAGIRTPKWQLLEYGEEDAARLAQELEMPCVIKTPGGGSSIGVYLPNTREELEQGLRDALRFGNRVLVEERIRGMELSNGVLGDRYLPPVEIVPSSAYFDYAAKYQSDQCREICPARIPESAAKEIGEMALALHRALGLQVYSRADFILDANNVPWCLETNSLPGMTPNSLVPKEAQADGMCYEQLCEEIVQRSFHITRRSTCSR